MSDIVSFEGFDGKVRVTEDGRYSVFDVIAFCGKKSQHEVWKRLTAQFPELLTYCEQYKFPGPGRGGSPVTGREGILQIIGLLPGAIGQKYRAEAAKVFVQYLDADPELVGSIIDRASLSQVEWIKARASGVLIRKKATSVAQLHGVTDFAACTNATYFGVFEKTAKELRREKGLRLKANVRPHLSTVELAAVAMAETLATSSIEEEDLQGQIECQDAFKDGGFAAREALRIHREARSKRAKK